MERTINTKKCTYPELFQDIGVGNYLHVKIGAYSKTALQAELVRQNKYYRIKTGNAMTTKYRQSVVMKKGYFTIYQQV